MFFIVNIEHDSVAYNTFRSTGLTIMKEQGQCQMNKKVNTDCAFGVIVI